ncbi:unnamed protein product [Macrosiphum euphorbiae]|uniref:Transposase n=1 Tax=Macrosiphum euphorbiae TaxID=13131 RepID=A0AAV0XBZ9_9HEMI|nr:unnamed protein product [Macrosiphum euphorbiae]
MVSLKVDGVSRHNKSFLGVKVQYMHKDTLTLKIKTLSIFELVERRSSKYLKDTLLDVISKYGLTKYQIYSITSDNAANMLKMTDLMKIDPDEETVPIRGIFARARMVVKKLRTPIYAGLLKQENKKQAIRDVETRWSFVYDMLYRLLELKDFCLKFQETMNDLKLSLPDWDNIEKMVAALEPAKIGLVSLQKSDITIGDFFAIWWNILAKLQKVDSLLSRAIIIAMNRRSILMFEEHIFSAVIYLDPRFQRMLTIDQKSIAKNHLNNTWNAMKYISEKIVNNDVVEATNDGTNCEINELDELEVY